MHSRIVAPILVAATFMSVWACGGDSKSPTAPTVAAPVVRTISVSPSGVGLESATQLTFSADTNATAPPSTFAWQFGDGSSTTGGPTATHVFTRSGSFTVQVTVANSAGQASASTSVRVASLIGTWVAAVTGHTGYPRQRPIPITWVELRLDQSPPGTNLTSLAATWIDDAGCRAGTGYRFSIFGSVRHPRSVSIGAESLPCNDGDFYLSGTADEEIRVITGTCGQGGANCQFRMVRQ